MSTICANKLERLLWQITEIENFPEAKKPTYKLKIDFGPEVGIKKSCAQLPKNYSKNDLKEKQVLGIVNFPARQIGPTVSEVLTLGVPDHEGNCILVIPDKDVPIGGKLY